MTGRVVIGGAGAVLGGYGVWLLLSRQDLDRLVDVGVWLAAGVLLHDLVLSPLVVVAGVLVARFLPRPARAPVTIGLVVLGSVTLLAIPVLGRFGARADNPTLLDRPYLAGWATLAALVLVCVVAGAVSRWRHASRPRAGGSAHGPGARG